MGYKYEIRKKSFDGQLDEVLSICKRRSEIPYEIERLGYKDSKKKLDEKGTMLYQKGKHNIVYVAYIKTEE